MRDGLQNIACAFPRARRAGDDLSISKALLSSVQQVRSTAQKSSHSGGKVLWELRTAQASRFADRPPDADE